MTDEQFSSLVEHAGALMDEHGVPGAAFGVLHDGEMHTAGLGVTSVEHALPVTDETLFQIGSTTKTVTATVLVLLGASGRLDLDAPVRTYVPELRLQDESVAAAVTVRHLLTHTAGWAGDVFRDTGPGDDALDRYVARMAEIPQLTPLGRLWSYNNAGFVLAGLVIERVAGKPYEDAAREIVLDPMGMDRSFFLPAEVMLHRFAVGHMVRDDGSVEIARPWGLPRSSNPTGALCSTVRDQLRYAGLHLGPEVPPGFDAVALQEMQQPTAHINGDRWMGLSWWLDDVGGTRIVSHGGATNGQLSAFWFAPEAGFAFTSLTNADRGDRMNRALGVWVREHYLGVVATTPEPVTGSSGDLAAYAGRYELAGVPTIIELTVDGDALLMHQVEADLSSFTDTPPDPFPPFHIAPYREDAFVAIDGPEKGSISSFVRGDEGEIAWYKTSRIWAKLRD